MIYWVLGVILAGAIAIYYYTGSKKKQVKQLTKTGNPKATVKSNKSVENPEPISKAYRKGELGEYKVDIQLDQLSSEYKYLSDVLLKTKRGLTQIDHIIITPAGVFVVETKNYIGKIYGKQFDKMWTQYCNGQKVKFYNPIRQNYGHVEALKELLNNPTEIHSIISFTRRCELRIDLDLRTADSPITVIYDTDLFDFVSKKVSILTHKQLKPRLSNEQIRNIYEVIKRANIQDPKIRQEHIEQIKQKNS